jgi:glutamine amidotransferase
MIVIIDYDAGNVASVKNAIERLGAACIISTEPVNIRQADKVIFPGVGEAAYAMNYLQQKGLDQLIPHLQQPVLGICLGLQLMCQHTEEGNTNCLGIFDTEVKLFPPLQLVPHMGWNTMSQRQGKLLQGISENDDVYFVHSYYAALCADTIAQTDYILPFSAALQKDNFYATQFHPEKSGSVGEKIIQNFLAL